MLEVMEYGGDGVVTCEIIESRTITLDSALLYGRVSRDQARHSGTA